MSEPGARRPRRPGPAARLLLSQLRGAIFDLDGVLTDTARLHRRAWRETFDDFFESHRAAGASVSGPFTDEEYLRLVDGRLRQDGARAVLLERGFGRPGEASLSARVEEIAARKDARYRELLASEGPAPYPSSIELARALQGVGVRLAVATASRHGAEVLRLAGLDGAIDALVDGRAAQANGLAGKPAPDTFLEAAARLGLAPGRCLVVEDAAQGVEAGRAGGFVVVAVDRLGRGEAAYPGADLVVGDLGELVLEGPGPSQDPWLFLDPDEDDEREGVRETLFSLGNGYLATRGARAWEEDDGRHYPGTYFAGVFDRISTTVDGREVDEDAIVNAPNWLAFTLSMAGGPWTGSAGVTIEPGGAVLDLEAGVLLRRYAVSDRTGRRCRVVERRLVSMATPHLVALEVSVVAENWSGRLELRAGVDGTVRDDKTVEERLLGGHHLQLVLAAADGASATLAVRTVQSGVVLAALQRASVHGGEATALGHHRGARVAQLFSLEVAEGQRVRCEKVVSLYSSKDAAISDALMAARAGLEEAGSFEELLAAHRAAWARLWTRSAVVVQDRTEAIQRLVNLHLFHVLQVASPHVVDRDIGLGARGLHGEGYLGHVFWDELFVLPMLTRRFPSTSRSLLAYRARRLPRARAAARAAGHRGAMFPWQSASDGRDETPQVLYNPRSGHWMPDNSRYQRHVGLAVAYNFWQYFETTRDEQHLFEVGAEVMLEVARFFADLASFDEDLGRYRIRAVMGPDEFHDGYPWREEPGVDDNAYTNLMTAWLLNHCRTVVELLHRSGRHELLERLGVVPEELARFDELAHRLHVPFMGEVLAQFDGYERLEPFDLAAYRARYGDLARLDLILEAEGDNVRRYQVGKQPDALMPLFLFSAEELRGILDRLGYRLGTDTLRETIAYYRTRVTHGSSLSRVVHAWINARLDRSSSWRYLSEALEADVHDLNKGTTREGIHLGAMAGTIELFERCYPGLEFRSDTLFLNPSLPEEVRGIGFPLEYRGHRLSIEIDHDRAAITAPDNPASSVSALIAGEPVVVPAGERVEVDLRPGG